MTTVRTVISFRVSVPVLSEQIVVVEPRVSTEESLRTITFRRAMRCVPSDSTIVVIAVSPSGTAATASDTASSSTSTRSASERSSSTSEDGRADHDRDGDDRDPEQLADPVELLLQRGLDLLRRLERAGDPARAPSPARWR